MTITWEFLAFNASHVSCQSPPYLCVTTHDAFRQNAIFLLPSPESSLRLDMTSGTGNPRLSKGLRAWKIPLKTKPWRAKLRLDVKNESPGSKDTRNITNSTKEKVSLHLLVSCRGEGAGDWTLGELRSEMWLGCLLCTSYLSLYTVLWQPPSRA
jgi:hypothetical protein